MQRSAQAADDPQTKPLNRSRLRSYLLSPVRTHGTYSAHEIVIPRARAHGK